MSHVCYWAAQLLSKTSNQSNTSGPVNASVDDTSPTQPNMTTFTEYAVGIFLVKYIWPVIIFAGTVGNALSFLVLMRRRMRRTSVYFYLAMLACADTCTLYLSGFKTWLRVLTGFELLHMSNASCKILMFLFLQTLHLSALFIVVITADRFLTVWFPFKNTAIHVVRRAGLVTLAAFCGILAYNVHVFWTIGLQVIGRNRTICAPFIENTFMCEVFPWLKLSMYTLIPFSLVFVLNIATIVKMSQAYYGLREEAACEDRTIKLKMGQYRITVMLLAVSVTWLLLTAPFTLFRFVSGNYTDPQSQAKEFLLKTVCFTLLYVNHSVNFYLYCVTGRRFRGELKEFMCAIKRWNVSSSRRQSTHMLRIGSNKDKENQAQTLQLRHMNYRCATQDRGVLSVEHINKHIP